MARILAFALNAQAGNLTFTKGISTDSEPDIWKINHDSSIDLWIELGHLDEKRLRQVASKSKLVSIYTYQGNQSLQWFQSVENSLSRFNNMTITHLTFPDDHAIEALVERGMNISCSIEEDEIWLSSETERLCITFKILKN